MAWTKEARAAAALARRAKALHKSPEALKGEFKAVLYRAGPTTNPTGSGVRFAPKAGAKPYSWLYKTSIDRFLVKIKKPFVAANVHDAAQKMGLIGDMNSYHDSIQRKSRKDPNANEKAWMKLDLDVAKKAKKLGHDGLVYSGLQGAYRSPYAALEVVAFKSLGQFKQIKRKKKPAP